MKKVILALFLFGFGGWGNGFGGWGNNGAGNVTADIGYNFVRPRTGPIPTSLFLPSTRRG